MIIVQFKNDGIDAKEYIEKIKRSRKFLDAFKFLTPKNFDLFNVGQNFVYNLKRLEFLVINVFSV